jgi:hypothetical protein
MKNIIKIIALSLIISVSFADYGYYGDAFILAGKSSQSIAMGGTGLTSLNGISSIISNPAGLAGYRQKEIYSQYNNLYGLATQNSIGFSMPYGNYQIGAIVNTVGVQLYRRDDIITNIPNINDRREYVRDFLDLESFYDFEGAALLSIARETPLDIKLGWSYDRFTIYFQYGLNLKLIYKSLDGESALGAGVDGGMRLIVPGNQVFYIKHMGDISIGLNMENVIQSPIIWFNNLNDYGNMRITGGIALHQPIKILQSELKIALDGYIYESQFFPKYGVRYGFQWKVKDFLDIRFGKDLSSITGGLGLKVSIPGGKLGIDYSIQYHEINWSHLVSLSYYWGEE